MINKAKTLKAKVQNIINNSEYRDVKVLGVTCSRADLESIEFLLNIFLQQGNIRGYVAYGNAKEVIEKSGIELKG